MLLLLGAEGVFFLTLVMVAVYLRTNELHSQFAAFRPSLLLPVTNTVAWLQRIHHVVGAPQRGA
ncbi:MAG: hypothetical protein R2838_26455 [Caldilineaceae bacterium]